MRPVPLLAGLFLDESDGVANLLSGVLLHVVLAVAQRGCQLENRDAVFKLKPLGDDAVAHQRAVTGCIALHGAGAQNRRVVINGHSGLSLRHGADVTGQTVFLSHVDIVAGGALVQQNRNIGGSDFAAEGNQSGKAHHDGLHFVFVHQNDLLGKLRIVADAAVAAEELVQKLCNVLDDQVLLHMADTQMLSPQTLGVPVNHHGHRKIVRHPAVTEHGLDVAGLHQYHPEHGHPVIQPAGIVIGGIDKAAPFAAASDAAAGIDLAEVFCSDSFVAHYLAPP